MDLPPSSRWFKQNTSEPLSLSNFRTELMTRISAIEQMKRALQEAYTPFGSERGVLPFQCRKAIQQLSDVKAEIRNCYTFLKDADAPPLVILALRYQLLNELSYLNEQVDKVTSHISDMNASRYSISLKEYIRELFANLFPLLEALPQQAAFMIEEARFQEKRLVDIAER